MEAAITKPRKPWLAALLSLLGGPLGQVYSGQFRRSVLLWFVGASLLPLLAFILISIPVGRAVVVLLLLCTLAFPIYLSADAFRLARQNRVAPLRRYQRWWVYVFLFVAFYLANVGIADGVRCFIAEAFVISSRSMSPTIQPGDRILADKLWYSSKWLKRNDLVIFRSAGPNSPLYVMRLVGLPGDEIEVADEKVLLNGTAWDDQYAVFDDDLPPYPALASYGPIRIPSDSFFILGDNRRMSKDSRILGPIPISDLYAKASMIYWSRQCIFPDPRGGAAFWWHLFAGSGGC